MMIKILRHDGSVLHEIEAAGVRDAVEKIAAARLSLSGADLSGADLSGADLSGANLSRANLSRAYLSRAYLSGAYLSGADLSGANLSGANLSGANLSGANLSRAYLSGADLSGADLSGADLSRAYLSRAYLSGDLAKTLSTPLLMLLDQPGKIRAYKLVTGDGMSPMSSTKLQYEKGRIVKVAKASTDDTEHCAAGVNVATLDWCCKEWRPGYRILVVEFTANDIAAIPIATDGKFRLHRCKVVGEKNVRKLGLGVKPEEAKQPEAVAT